MRRRVLIAQMVLAVVAVSCVPPPPQHMQDLGRVMDEMVERQAEFGTISVSAPILSAPDSVFTFQPGKTASDFYSDAKNSIQARASEFQQQLTSFGLGANVSINPVAAAGYLAQLQQYEAAVNQNNATTAAATQQQAIVNAAAQQALAADLKAAATPADYATAISNYQTATQGKGPAAVPAFPTALAPTTAPTLVTPPDVSSKFATSANGPLFSGFQQLANNPNPLTISDRTALVTAAGDNAVSAMFQVMGNPQLSQAFHNKRILFGVCTVSVNPGWRTHKGYAANVGMECSYKGLTARATVLQQFVKYPKVPAALRLRLAIDQDLSLPNDKAVIDLVKSIAKNTPQLQKWCVGADTPTLTEQEMDALSTDLGSPAIPPAYKDRQDDTHSNRLLLAAVSPLTDVQTLDLSSSFRQEQELAINLAFQLQLAGSSGQAQTFLKFAKSLEQDFSSLTPDVVANSYSTGEMFGFQVGPQLRAIEEARRGKASGPGEILERQSFPALVIYGFDADDILPYVTVTPDGKYQLLEPVVNMVSAHSWVSVDGKRPLWTETERLQMAFWLKKYLSRLNSFDADPPTLRYTINRINELCTMVFGDQYDFALPEELILPPAAPTITAVEPNPIKCPQSGFAAVDVVLEGTNLDMVDLSRVSLVSGGTQEGAAHLHGSSAISARILVNASEEPPPIIFALPTYNGPSIYTPAITPLSGSRPDVTRIAPDVIALDADPAGNVHPANIDAIIIGHNLNQINAGTICSTNPAIVQVSSATNIGNSAITLKLHVSAPIASLAFQLPRSDDKNVFIYTPPIVVTGKRMTVAVDTDSYQLQNATPLATPTGLKIQTGNGIVKLSWQLSKNATSYEIRYGQAGGNMNLLAAVPTGNSKTFKTLDPNKEYQFEVVAVNAAGKSPPSTPVSGKSSVISPALAPAPAPAASPARPTPAPDPAADSPQPSNPSSGDQPSDKNSSAQPNITVFRSHMTVQYSPGISDSVVNATIGATTKPAGQQQDKSAGNNSSSSSGNAVDLELSLKSGPATQPSQSSDSNKSAGK
jgi:Fibronectin type III domain